MTMASYCYKCILFEQKKMHCKAGRTVDIIHRGMIGCDEGVPHFCSSVDWELQGYLEDNPIVKPKQKVKG